MKPEEIKNEKLVQELNEEELDNVSGGLTKGLIIPEGEDNNNTPLQGFF